MKRSEHPEGTVKFFDTLPGMNLNIDLTFPVTGPCPFLWMGDSFEISFG